MSNLRRQNDKNILKDTHVSIKKKLLQLENLVRASSRLYSFTVK